MIASPPRGTSAAPDDTAELGAWALAHYEEPFYSQRTAKLPGKLRQLGILDLPRDARILDAGCGKGEALAILRRYGFTNLAGADFRQHAEWQGIPDCDFRVSDARRTPFDDNQFDAIINLHALHHMGGPRGVASFLDECRRLLKPGGKLFILDYTGSPQIRLLHWALRHRIGTITPGLQNFARIQDEEWPFLGPYLRSWPATRTAIYTSGFEVTRWKQAFWLYYLTLTKPLAPTSAASTQREADEAWTDNYMDPSQHRRRKEQMRAKLERLGITKAPRDAHIYDLCCGMGEALETLHELGFRNLHGVDLTSYPNLARDPRFEVIQSDVCELPLPDGCADWIINVHSLHHLQTSDNVRRFMDECYRILKPGGYVGVVDFPNSLRIRLAFNFLRLNPFRVTPYLRWFGKLVESEWYFLPGYMSEWPTVRRLLFEGRFRVESCTWDLFYFHLRLRRPADPATSP